jgi:hypothetical protein
MREDYSGVRVMFGAVEESPNWRLERLVIKRLDGRRHAENARELRTGNLQLTTGFGKLRESSAVILLPGFPLRSLKTLAAQTSENTKS